MWEVATGLTGVVLGVLLHLIATRGAACSADDLEMQLSKEKLVSRYWQDETQRQMRENDRLREVINSQRNIIHNVNQRLQKEEKGNGPERQTV